MGRQSKYGQFGNRRPPHKKRTIRIPGSGDDDGKWFRCWNCGFINNIDRNAIGQGEGDISSVTLGVVDVDVAGGCSLCGSLNYR